LERSPFLVRIDRLGSCVFLATTSPAVASADSFANTRDRSDADSLAAQYHPSTNRRERIVLKPVELGHLRGMYKGEPVDVVALDTEVDAEKAMCVIQYTPLSEPTGRLELPFREVEHLSGPGVVNR
jgi:hypothetical protein